MKKKVLAIFMAMMMGVGVLSGTAAAAEVPPESGEYAIVSVGSGTEIVPYADEIIMYYAINKNDGKLYQRRWNATRGYWVDKDWVLVK